MKVNKSDILIDNENNEWHITDASDIHNIEAYTLDGGGALFCLDKECSQYVGNKLRLKEIKG